MNKLTRYLRALKSTALSIVAPKTLQKGGLTQDNNYSASSATTVLSQPGYTDHLDDILTLRADDESPDLLQVLFRSDPDVSAAVHAYLTLADTECHWEVFDLNGVLSPDGNQLVQQLITSLFVRTDYQTLGYDARPSFRLFCEQQRYMTLMRGSLASELVLGDDGWPQQLTVVDTGTLRWYETDVNVYIPHQITDRDSTDITLDVPTFKYVPYRQDPTGMYTYSPFISAINTIAARQEVINDLYRIMRLTGFPRLKVKILEQTLRDVAPEVCKNDEAKMRTWLSTRRDEISSALAYMSPDQAIVAFDSYDIDILNSNKPGAEINIESVISTLNAQNQAALKAVAPVLGRGTSGVNTASTETRIFAMAADALNGPLADVLSYMFTLALALQGQQLIVKVSFEHAELRSELELEANKQIRQTRLLTDLSLGNITDDDYQWRMYHRARPASAPLLSGTGFAISGSTVDTTASGEAAGSSPDSVTRQTGGDTSTSKSNGSGSVSGS